MDPELPSSDGRSSRRLYNRGKAAQPISDADRVLQLQLETSLGDTNGPEWRAIRDDVWAYCTRTLNALIRDGRVWSHYRRLGRPSAVDLRMPVGGVDFDVRHDLVTDTIAGMLPILRDQLLTGVWTADGGASIRTWATSLAVLRLSGPWRKWLRAQHNEQQAYYRLNEMRDSEPEQPDAVLHRLEFDRYVELLDDDLQPLFVLDCDIDGLTDVEIAGLLGLTVKKVEYRLKKGRAALREEIDRESVQDRRELFRGDTHRSA